MKRIFFITLAAQISACTASDNAAYPSLAPRPIERIAENEPAASGSPVKKPADPAISKKVETARTALADADRNLNQAIAAAAELAPRAVPGSEAWAESQVALSRLVSAETALRNVGIDIGAIMAELAQARISGVDTAALEAEAAALQEQAAALAARGRAEIDSRRR